MPLIHGVENVISLKYTDIREKSLQKLFKKNRRNRNDID
jgi:hypothetical protein